MANYESADYLSTLAVQKWLTTRPEVAAIGDSDFADLASKCVRHIEAHRDELVAEFGTIPSPKTLEHIFQRLKEVGLAPTLPEIRQPEQPRNPYASLTARDIEKMPALRYQLKLNDPDFRAHVETLAARGELSTRYSSILGLADVAVDPSVSGPVRSKGGDPAEFERFYDDCMAGRRPFGGIRKRADKEKAFADWWEKKAHSETVVVAG